MSKKLLVLLIVLVLRSVAYSQVNDTITEERVSRIIHYLAADSLKGRGNGQPGLLQAGLFIGEEFRRSDLRSLPGYSGYFLSFHPYEGTKELESDDLSWNGAMLAPQRFVYIRPTPGNYKTRTLADFSIVKLDTSFTEDLLSKYAGDSSALLLWTDRKQAGEVNFFPVSIKMPARGVKRDILLVYAESAPVSLVLTGNEAYYSKLGYNVVGFLPGKSKPNEVIIFSAHYDHMGVVGKAKDNILNGANDNASGTTALIALAHYFSLRNDNERTIMFCAFSGEELGLLGSYDFVRQINTDNIKAGINIEMIGVQEYGKNTVFVTGENFSSLPRILIPQLKQNGMKVRPDPDPNRNLFMRSDNYPFALRGVPFHTIQASDDYDKCYHQSCDQTDRIDIPNMTRIIKAIAASAIMLINKEKTPSRINPSRIMESAK